jgi:hypothetical protein
MFRSALINVKVINVVLDGVREFKGETVHFLSTAVWRRRREVHVQVQTFVIFAVHGGECSSSCFSRFTAEKESIQSIACSWNNLKSFLKQVWIVRQFVLETIFNNLPPHIWTMGVGEETLSRCLINSRWLNYTGMSIPSPGRNKCSSIAMLNILV